MRTWEDYKETFPKSPDIFDLARSGDLRGLADLLQASPDLDLNQRNQSGFSPLMLAAYRGQTEFCEALLRGGVDPESCDNAGNSVLMACAFKGNLELVKILLNAGASHTLRNSAGMNVLDWAVMFGRREVIEYFQSTVPDCKRTNLLVAIIRFLRLGWQILVKKGKGYYPRPVKS